MRMLRRRPSAWGVRTSTDVLRRRLGERGSRAPSKHVAHEGAASVRHERVGTWLDVPICTERERETVDTGVSSGNGKKQTCKGPCYTPVPRKSSSATAPGTGAGAGAASGTGTGVGTDAGAVGEAEAEAEEGIAAMMTYALS
jgi:hypothetical protein